uniref:XPG N-terminal domain-containing protein n=1 Tax=Esox lucius TaxID=8010 RepID=A0A6Q2XVG1_ESOLU
MGVRGLTSFIEGDRTFCKDIHFRNSKLIIDGCNLYNLLYFNSNLDQSHGGDYDAFDDKLRKFFQALKDCGIDPYVVLDGGSNSNNCKLETHKQRAQSRINSASNIGLYGSGSLLPTLVYQVFKQLLTSLNVPMAQCLGEADQEIASLAHRWNCPVLSNDSDFYIFDIKAGFLPISHFQWQKVSVNQASSQKYIPCKHYTTTSFCRYFNINKQLLPVFAAVVGNDYVSLRNMGIFLRWEDHTSVEGRFAHFNGLLSWLASFQGQEEALDSVLKRIDHSYNRQKMSLARSGLSLAIEEYKVPSGFLESFFSSGVAPGPCRLPVPHRVLPDWTLLPLMKGRLPSCIVDVLQMRRQIMGTQVEDLRMPSGNITSRPIRQVLYGLLLAGRRECQSSDGPPVEYVEEYDREGMNLTSSMVEAVLPSASEQLQLDTLHRAPHSVRCEVILETLGVSSSSLSGVPPHLRLPVAVTCYWLRHAHPQPDKPLLEALLLGLVYGELRRQRKYERAKRPERELFERLRGHIKKPTGSPDLVVAHSYSQWQCCLKDSVHLNQLLSLPLPDPQCAWLYKGTLVHQLEAKLRGTMTPDSLLVESHSFEQLYRAMLRVIHNSHAAGLNSKVSGAIPPSLKKPQDDLMARMQVLALEEDDSGAEGGENPKQEDDVGWTLVRTRHKTKKRYNQSQNPEFSQKQGRISWE